MAAGLELRQETLAVGHEALSFYVLPDLLLLFNAHHPFLQLLLRMSLWTMVTVLTGLWSGHSGTTTVDGRLWSDVQRGSESGLLLVSPDS